LTLSKRKRLPNGKYVPTSPELIELDRVMNTLKLDKTKLITLAILIGTDYNIGGVKGIGPKKALEIVRKFSTPTQLFNQIKPDFDWKEVFDLFEKMPVEKDYELKWDSINKEKVRKLLVDNYDFSEERVETTLQKLTKKQEDKDQKGLKEFLK